MEVAKLVQSFTLLLIRSIVNKSSVVPPKRARKAWSEDVAKWAGRKMCPEAWPRRRSRKTWSIILLDFES